MTPYIVVLVMLAIFGYMAIQILAGDKDDKPPKE